MWRSKGSSSCDAKEDTTKGSVRLEWEEVSECLVKRDLGQSREQRIGGTGDGRGNKGQSTAEGSIPAGKARVGVSNRA